MYPIWPFWFHQRTCLQFLSRREEGVLYFLKRAITRFNPNTVLGPLGNGGVIREDRIQVPIFNREVVSLRPSQSIRDIVKPEHA